MALGVVVSDVLELSRLPKRLGVVPVQMPEPLVEVRVTAPTGLVSSGSRGMLLRQRTHMSRILHLKCCTYTGSNRMIVVNRRTSASVTCGEDSR